MTSFFIGSAAWYLGGITSRAWLDGDLTLHNIPKHSPFSSNYAMARTKFLEVAAERSLDVESIQHPLPGPDGNPIFVDVAFIGSREATKILLLSSGTHGVEGYAGSGIQIGLLRENFFDQLPQDTGILLIHSINPFGMSHLRRFKEDNIDLNRNFRDYTKPAPINKPYNELADAIAPTNLSFGKEVSSWGAMVSYLVTDGMQNLKEAVSSGQYTHPEGLFFGGNKEAWSSTNLRSIVDKYLRNAAEVVIIDVHTGLGEFGAAEAIMNIPMNSMEYQRAVSIWGEDAVRSTVSGDSVSVHLDATLKLAFPKMMPHAQVTATSLEFGTVPPMDVIVSLRAENWLFNYGADGETTAPKIKLCLLEAFYPDSQEWRDAVWLKGRTNVRQALEWLSQH